MTLWALQELGQPGHLSASPDCPAGAFPANPIPKSPLPRDGNSEQRLPTTPGPTLRPSCSNPSSNLQHPSLFGSTKEQFFPPFLPDFQLPLALFPSEQQHFMGSWGGHKISGFLQKSIKSPQRKKTKPNKQAKNPKTCRKSSCLLFSRVKEGKKIKIRIYG